MNNRDKFRPYEPIDHQRPDRRNNPRPGYEHDPWIEGDGWKPTWRTGVVLLAIIVLVSYLLHLVPS